MPCPGEEAAEEVYAEPRCVLSSLQCCVYCLEGVSAATVLSPSRPALDFGARHLQASSMMPQPTVSTSPAVVLGSLVAKWAGVGAWVLLNIARLSYKVSQISGVLWTPWQKHHSSGGYTWAVEFGGIAPHICRRGLVTGRHPQWQTMPGVLQFMKYSWQSLPWYSWHSLHSMPGVLQFMAYRQGKDSD